MAALRGLLLVLLFTTPVWAASGTRVTAIDIEGLERTQQRTVLRQLPFAVGDAWQSSFEETGERWLRNLGLFSEVDIRPPDAQGRVRIRVHERWSLWLLPTATRKDNGASSAGLTLDEYNLWGLQHHLRLAYQEDTGTNFTRANGSSYDLRYDWTRVNDSNFGLSFSSHWGRNIFDAYRNGVLTSQYIQDGRSIALGFSYALGEVPGEGWGIAAGLAGSTSSYTLISGPAQPDVRGSRRRTLSFGLNYRQVDDRIVWFSGSAFDYSLSATAKAFGSTLNVYRQTLSARTYVPLRHQHTINLRLDLGHAFGEVLRDGLFDLGHRNGLRGYFPGEVQGRAYALGSLEGRFMLYPDANFQIAAFSDMGYVAGRDSTVTGRNFYAGAGVGFRWTLRWLVNGTIRGDAAYGFATRRWRFYIGTGQAF